MYLTSGLHQPEPSSWRSWKKLLLWNVLLAQACWDQSSTQYDALAHPHQKPSNLEKKPEGIAQKLSTNATTAFVALATGSQNLILVLLPPSPFLQSGLEGRHSASE